MARRIVLLTEGVADPIRAKTAVALLRYRPDEVVAVLDAAHAPSTPRELFGIDHPAPVIASIADADRPDTLIVGIATSGGCLPDAMRGHIAAGLRRGINLVSGLHTFLGDDAELAEIAAASGATIEDVRRNNEREVAHRKNIDPDCLRILTVGNDCSCGKMVTSIAVTEALIDAGHDARFVATGQTGILIQGDGCPIDCVVADFINGAAERLILANQHHDILVIEGQGSLSHPRYSSVTLGLLHGCMPDGLILCHELGRTEVLNMPGQTIPPLEDLIGFYEQAAAFAHPCRVIGIAMNSRGVSDERAAEARADLMRRTGLPVADPLRDGPGALVAAVLGLQRELGKRSKRVAAG